MNLYPLPELREAWLRLGVAIVELAVVDGVPVTKRSFFNTLLFENICDASGVDADAAREQIRRRRAEIRARVRPHQAAYQQAWQRRKERAKGALTP